MWADSPDPLAVKLKNFLWYWKAYLPDGAAGEISVMLETETKKENDFIQALKDIETLNKWISENNERTEDVKETSLRISAIIERLLEKLK